MTCFTIIGNSLDEQREAGFRAICVDGPTRTNETSSSKRQGDVSSFTFSVFSPDVVQGPDPDETRKISFALCLGS